MWGSSALTSRGRVGHTSELPFKSFPLVSDGSSIDLRMVGVLLFPVVPLHPSVNRKATNNPSDR